MRPQFTCFTCCTGAKSTSSDAKARCSHFTCLNGAKVQILTQKTLLDAFPGSDLEAHLVRNNIRTVVLGGLLTNCCVESTMRTAYEKGFNVVTLKDCTAATSEEGQVRTFLAFLVQEYV